MCGIVGVTGSSNVIERLFRGIHNLEYRGYDSCGIATINNGHIDLRKDVGSVDEVNSKQRFQELSGLVGIAHTRWATHGGVTKENAHPHMSNDGSIAAVHNGIISNHRQIRDWLSARGHEFKSETDTEVIPHLVEHYFKKYGDVEEAFWHALRELEGSYAIVMVSVNAPERIFCAKKRSPLIIGLGESTNYIGSDFNSFIDFTKQAVVLDDDEFGVIFKNDYYIKNLFTRDLVEKEITTIAWDAEMAKKGGYPHFMLKEIHEQPMAVSSAIEVDRDKVHQMAKEIARAEEVYLIGMGTTYYVALIAQQIFAQFGNRYVAAHAADEFRHVCKPSEKALVLAFSQSGETYDTLEALNYSREYGTRTAAVVNVIGSSIARQVDRAILQMSGPEISVISTKAALAQIVIIYQLAIAMGRAAPGVDAAFHSKLDDAEQAILELSEQITSLLNEKSGWLNKLAKNSYKIKNWLFLGRGPYRSIAMECALKMKEVAYLHAEGMGAGFLKHGTLALIDDAIRCLIFVPPQEDALLHSLTLASVEEIKARGGYTVGFVHDPIVGLFDEVIQLPMASPHTAPLLQLVCGQLFSYFTAVALKRNIDKPRSLAKSVTVP